MGFFLFRSSAGSGKTYTLVKEYLKIILKNPEKFKHILAVTFTNKAAGEMKERIMLSLKRLSRGEDPALAEVLQQEIPDMQKLAEAVFPNIEILHRLSERWILYFGILFILVVFFFPKGFVGTARDMIARRGKAGAGRD